MSKTLKVLHLLGLTLFLGSIFAHIVAGLVGGPIGSPGFVLARQEVVTATRLLTLPGLGLALLTGLAMAARLPVRRGWLWLHGGLALLVAAISALVVVPAGQATLAGGAVAGALLREHLFGGLNILLTLAILVLGVARPSLGRTGAAR